MPNHLTFDKTQVGHKWGEHKKDYPQLNDYNEYKQYAENVFSSPEKVYYYQEQDQYFFVKGTDLLRVRPDGSFVSLYRGANTSTVLNALRIL